MPANQARMALFGVGAMGSTVLQGLVNSGYPKEKLVFAERHVGLREQNEANFGVRSVATNSEAAEWCEVAWIIVKPQDALQLLDEISPSLQPGTLIVSLCVGLTTEILGRHLPEGTPVVRVMPNLPARIGQGVSGISGGSTATDDQIALVAELMSSVGTAVVVPEGEQAAVAAVSGSGPAYLFAVAEAMVNAGVELGLTKDAADSLVRQTLLGSATLLAESTEEPQELRRQVTSKKGTTEAAIKVFTEQGLTEMFSAALAAAVARSNELAAELGAAG